MNHLEFVGFPFPPVKPGLKHPGFSATESRCETAEAPTSSHSSEADASRVEARHPLESSAQAMGGPRRVGGFRLGGSWSNGPKMIGEIRGFERDTETVDLKLVKFDCLIVHDMVFLMSLQNLECASFLVELTGAQ